ncbi:MULTISPECIES: helix-turn-helix domain-containing protein [Vibrio]|uniref:AraC family transcriptional regulator n=1 Tax=Vibrio chanodichtyis TaxID=3027932 RepID=A0ABT5UZ57_9VIBR|nr:MULTISPECIES: AraC family transcriptional regulator [Vibrio]MDE1513554.1 AraC family transcriptional regulator [Vibrio chanodichtyis]
MSQAIVQTGQFKGLRKQPLHNVLIYAPTIIWVTQGDKQLWWHDTTLNFNATDWLLLPANQYLTFVNVPQQAQFYSRTLTLYQAPPAEWIAQSNQSALSQPPKIKVTSALAWCFELVYQMHQQSLATETQRQLVLGLYAQLREANALHLLFPSANASMRERVARYLSVNPGDEHSIETVATHFAMSRATLARHLAGEGSGFREVLSEVRMNYALALLQELRPLMEVALACGYQSLTRFSARFKQQFQLTPYQYSQTLLAEMK